MVSKSAVLSGLMRMSTRPASLENVQGLAAGVASREGSGSCDATTSCGFCADAVDETETKTQAARMAAAIRPYLLRGPLSLGACRAGTAADNPSYFPRSRKEFRCSSAPIAGFAYESEYVL